MRKLKCTLTFVAILFCLITSAQKSQPKFKFGDVKPEDFEPKVYAVDSNASAVVLADIGDSYFEINSHTGFSLVFTHLKRIRILNKNGFDEATIKIPIYSNSSSEENLDKLEAVTYNLEDGKVVATKLDKSSIFKDKYNEHLLLKKFTFPNIKEGSIIEYKYQLSSPFLFNLQPWDFQQKVPCLWSEYQVTIPNDIFDYAILKTSYLPFIVETASSSSRRYSIFVGGRSLEIPSNTMTSKWAMQNIPALKPENFITTLDNYKSRIDFQLRRITYSPMDVQEVIGSWYQMAEKMMKREDFGLPLKANNGWMSDDLKKITAGTTDNYSKAKKIFEYIRDNFTCIDDEALFLSKPIKKVFSDKNGTVADLNLSLVAALKHLDYEAVPAILSTREHGFANEIYPLMDKFNYVICRVKIGDNYYLLDASNKNIGFGKLPAKAYNGSARIIDDAPLLVDLSADSLKETKITTLFMMNEDNKINGTLSTQYGNFNSAKMREKLSKKESADYLREVKKEYGFDVDLNNVEIDSLKIPEEPLTVKYDIQFSLDDDIFYFNPIITSEQIKENPFKATERLFPVEMSSCTDETYILNMEVPNGYKVEELPKSARVMLNDDEGMFEYIIGENGGRIQLRCRTVIKKATFDPEDYQTLRDFFAFIVNKESEQIVFKKVN